MSTFQLFYGKLYTFFSIKIVYPCAIAIFEIGSLICAVAPSSIALILGRTFAGLGGAGIFSGSILVTTKMIPLDRRAAYTGLLSGMFGLSAVIGPFLGGALTEKVSWRWCFGINLPLGFVAAVVCGILVKTPMTDATKSMTFLNKVKEFDLIGTIMLMATLVCLILALQLGGIVYDWSSARIIVLFVLSGVLFMVFVAIQSFRRHQKTIPPSMSRSRSVWFASLYGICIYGAVYVTVTYLPIWFQAVQQVSAFESGVRITPLIAGYVVFSLMGGILTSVMGYYNPTMFVGTTLASIGGGLVLTFSPTISTAKFIGYQALYGFGVGLANQQPSFIVQTILPEDDIPIGVAFITLVQNLSASVFVAIAHAIFLNRLQSDLPPSGNDQDSSSILQSGATDLSKLYPSNELPSVLNLYSASIVRALYIVPILSACSIIGALGTEWRSMRAQGKSESEKNGVVEQEK